MTFPATPQEKDPFNPSLPPPPFAPLQPTLSQVQSAREVQSEFTPKEVSRSSSLRYQILEQQEGREQDASLLAPTFSFIRAWDLEERGACRCIELVSFLKELKWEDQGEGAREVEIQL